MLFNSIKKLLDRSHSSLDIDDDAVEFVADLSFKLIAMLFENPLPRCIQDVEDRVLTVFPTPIDKWALRDAKEIFDRGKKRSMLPVDKLHQFMQKVTFGDGYTTDTNKGSLSGVTPRIASNFGKR